MDIDALSCVLNVERSNRLYSFILGQTDRHERFHIRAIAHCGHE